jgi:hydrogenase maturation protease
MTVVVGLGTAYGGDDAVGLVVAERLRALRLPALTVPDASALVALLGTRRRVVLVDAVVGAGAPGEVIHLAGEEIARETRVKPVSSHALGVADAIAMARALDEGCASDVHLVGIIIDAPRAPATSLSAPVATAVDRAVALARALAE